MPQIVKMEVSYTRLFHCSKERGTDLCSGLTISQAKNKFTLSYAKFASTNLNWVQFEKVEGHTGITGNEFVDKLAKSALGI